jgi:hypothetical protein
VPNVSHLENFRNTFNQILSLSSARAGTRCWSAKAAGQIRGLRRLAFFEEAMA